MKKSYLRFTQSVSGATKRGPSSKTNARVSPSENSMAYLYYSLSRVVDNLCVVDALHDGDERCRLLVGQSARFFFAWNNPPAWIMSSLRSDLVAFRNAARRDGNMIESIPAVYAVLTVGTARASLPHIAFFATNLGQKLAVFHQRKRDI